MQEIKCPNCGKTFVVDDAGYAQIVRQVRDSEFDRELLKREKDIADAKAREAELAQITGTVQTSDSAAPAGKGHR